MDSLAITAFADRFPQIIPLLCEANYHEIIQQLNNPVDLSDKLGPELLIPRLFVVGLGHFKISKFNEAKKYFKSCEAKAMIISMRQSGGNGDVGTTLGDVMLCNVYLGDIELFSCKYLKAAEYYQKAIKVFYPESVLATYFRLRTPTLSIVRAKLALSFGKDSKFVDAVTEYRAAIQVAHRDSDQLSAHVSLGNLYYSMKEFPNALEQYNTSIELASRLNKPLCLGRIHENIAFTYLGLHNKEEAVCCFQKSLRFITEYENDPRVLFRTYNHFGSAFQSMNDLIKAEEYYALALRHAKAIGDKSCMVRIHDKISNIHLIRMDYEQAILHYTEILKLSSNPADVNMARLNRGYAYLKWANSLVIPDEPFQPKIHGQQCDVNTCLSKLSPTIKNLYEQGRCDLQNVVDYYEREIQKFNYLVCSSSSFTLAYSCLQDCYISLHEYEEALVVAEKNRARLLGEHMLKGGKFNQKRNIASPISFPHIRKVVKNSQNPVVYLSYTGSHVICWALISVSGQVVTRWFKVPMLNSLFGGQSLHRFLTHELASAMMDCSNDVYQSIAHGSNLTAEIHTLFNLFGKPLLDILNTFESAKSSFNKLTIIADEYSALVPFCCLYDQSTKSFLADKFHFERVPSFLTLDIMLHQPTIRAILPADCSKMCVIGNPSVLHAKEEAEWVAHMLHTTPALQHESMLSLRLSLLNAKVIHISTDGCKEDGALVVASGREGGASDIILHPQTIQRLNIPTALVVFTNCGDFVTTPIRINCMKVMCQAFIEAGAQAVFTSLWKIPSKSASFFMQFFYQYLSDGLLSSLAVQKAIISIRCFPEFSQYIHWSGYQLIGQDITLSFEETPQISDLKVRMGATSVFPRYKDILTLKENLISNNQMDPSNVQVLCGVEPSEIMIDFITAFHEKFLGGIFWLNCKRIEFVRAGIESIEMIIGMSISELPLSDSKQALYVLDGVADLADCSALTSVLKDKNVHTVILRSHVNSKIIEGIKHTFRRAVNVINIQPLSSLQSTQRIVHSIMAKHSYVPTHDNDKQMFQSLGEFTCGSPAITNVTSQVLLSRLSTNKLEQSKVFSEFSNDISLSTPKHSKNSDHHHYAPRPISEHVSRVIPSVSDSMILSDCRDVWETAEAKYDSWYSLMKLVSASNLSQEQLLLFRCLSVFHCCPIPVSLALGLSTVILSDSGIHDIAADEKQKLLSKLLQLKLIENYPLPVIYHPSFHHQINGAKLLCMPQCIAEGVWKCMEVIDRSAVLCITNHVLSRSTWQDTNEMVSGLYMRFKQLQQTCIPDHCE